MDADLLLQDADPVEQTADGAGYRIRDQVMVQVHPVRIGTGGAPALDHLGGDAYHSPLLWHIPDHD